VASIENGFETEGAVDICVQPILVYGSLLNRVFTVIGTADSIEQSGRVFDFVD